MQDNNFLEIYSIKDFRNWLIKNHDKEKKISLIIHKKHTGKNSPNQMGLMKEAICFGWIDTTIKRLDGDRYIRTFVRRSKNSKWSRNTLKYGKELIKAKRMMPSGLAFYKEGLKKLPHDYNLEDNPEIPLDLINALEKSKKSKENFDKLAPSYKKTYLRWIIRAKLPETRKKRIKAVVKMIKEKIKISIAG
jgi:uncharacterized protein YdeI (YjbR/CyaY-like superfamily)